MTMTKTHAKTKTELPIILPVYISFLNKCCNRYIWTNMNMALHLTVAKTKTKTKTMTKTMTKKKTKRLKDPTCAIFLKMI